MQTFLPIPGLYYVSEDRIFFVLRWYYVNAVVSTTLLSPYCVLVRSRPHYVYLTCSKFAHVNQDRTTLLSPYCVLVRSRSHYDYFEHVQNSPTSTKTIKIASRPYRFLLRSFYVVQVRTASKRFYIDVVRTWSSVTGVLVTKAPVTPRQRPQRPYYVLKT